MILTQMANCHSWLPVNDGYVFGLGEPRKRIVDCYVLEGRASESLSQWEGCIWPEMTNERPWGSLILQQVPPDPQTVLSFTKLLREWGKARGKSCVSGLFGENCVILGPLPRSDSLSQYLGWIQFHQRTLSNIYSSFKRRKKMCNVK